MLEHPLQEGDYYLEKLYWLNSTTSSLPVMTSKASLIHLQLKQQIKIISYLQFTPPNPLHTQISHSPHDFLCNKKKNQNIADSKLVVFTSKSCNIWKTHLFLWFFVSFQLGTPYFVGKCPILFYWTYFFSLNSRCNIFNDHSIDWTLYSIIKTCITIITQCIFH